MKRSTKLFCFLLCICLPLFTSCATTTITDTWKDKTYQGKAQNMVVIMVARTQHLRNMFEGRFVAELRARGNNATQSNKIVTFEELTDKELVKSKIKSTDADTVLIARLVDSKRIETYEPGHIKGIPIAYSYWGTYYAIVSVDYGYTDDIQVAYVETNLYDVKTEKLIWSARSKTERSGGEQHLINTFINRIVKKLSSDKIIK
ncbi:MAG TPA: hypothetical protein ENH82_11280 [bacterium]|nr:hypothetical protein [bacterium]